MKAWAKRSAEIRHARDAATAARDVPSAYAALPEAAKTLKRVLEERSVYSADRAIPDRELAKLVGCPARNLVELAEALTAIDCAVLAGEKGRYISEDADEIDRYAELCHERAKAIHGRGKSYTDLAARKREAQRKARGGQEWLM